MDVAGIDWAVLVGCSRAGQIALDTALAYPDRVTGLVWVCGGISGVDLEETPEEAALDAREEALREARDFAGLAAFDVEVWIDGRGRPDGRGPEAVRDLVRRMTYETYVQEKPYGDPIQLDPPAAGRLGELHVPVLAIVGSYDMPGPAIQASVLEAGSPHVRRVDVDTAHLPNLERPEWFTTTLLEFLEAVDG
jgi:pimeloyl-ACP methyl ester carboxylesterase